MVDDLAAEPAPETPADHADVGGDAFGGEGPGEGEPMTDEAVDGEDRPVEEEAAEMGTELLRQSAGGRASNGQRGPQRGRDAGVTIKEWNPKAPYLDAIRDAGKGNYYAEYMKQRTDYTDSPAFFLDCADQFNKLKEPALAQRILSNLAEMQLDDAQILRVLAHRLAQWGSLDLSVITFEEVLSLRPEEPQSYRDLALVLACRADEKARVLTVKNMTSDLGERLNAEMRDDYVRSIELLYEVVLGEWDGRFDQIELIALEEINRLLPRAKANGVDIAALGIDKRLVKLLDVDVRIVMTWHADNTDIDLWVIEPSGEKADYSHNRTTIGGRVSRDFTGGYGPEQYTVHRAMPGTYTVKAHYYGSGAVKLLGSCTVQVDVFTNYGRPNEERKSLTLQLKEKDDTYEIGSIEF
jgi:Ca-activated chloride channel family protein